MISTFTAFFDANVFYGARLRSLVVSLAETKLFRARWSDDIHDEWTSNLLLNRPDLKAADLDKTRRMMNAAVLDSLVTGYHSIIDTLTLPDQNDRHVLAAAIVCRASCVVTFNLSDFPSDALDPFGLHAVHPDEFLLDTQSIDPTAFAEAIHGDLTHYTSPPLSLSNYVESLRKAGVPKAAKQVAGLSILLETPKAKE